VCIYGLATAVNEFIKFCFCARMLIIIGLICLWFDGHCSGTSNSKDQYG